MWLLFQRHGQPLLLAPLGQSYYVTGGASEFFVASQAAGTVLQFQHVLLDGPHATHADAERVLLRLAERVRAERV